LLAHDSPTFLLLQLFSFGSNAQEKRGWPGDRGLAVVLWFVASTLVFTVVVVVVVGLAVTLLVVGAKVVVVVVFLVVVLLGAAVVFCRFTDG